MENQEPSFNITARTELIAGKRTTFVSGLMKKKDFGGKDKSYIYSREYYPARGASDTEIAYQVLKTAADLLGGGIVYYNLPYLPENVQPSAINNVRFVASDNTLLVQELDKRIRDTAMREAR